MRWGGGITVVWPLSWQEREEQRLIGASGKSAKSAGQDKVRHLNDVLSVCVRPTYINIYESG